VPDVVEDLESAGRMAADHFAERGFGHVAYLGHKPWSNARRMYEAFVDQANRHEMVCHLHQFEKHADEKDHVERERLRLPALVRWLRDTPKPVGVLTYSDDRAARTCVAVAKAGLSVPDDVGILGFGNQSILCEMAPVKLSSIDDNKEAMGIKAASILNGMMTGGPLPSTPTYVSPRGIVERQSTNVLAVGDPDISRAIRFLWDHLDQDIGVDEVAAAIGLPRRTLTRRFRQALGRSIIDELRRKRLQETKQLLLETNLAVTDIAVQAGFRSESLLYRAFRSQFQMTPCQFRASHAAQ
jgi:LacI family transcriptional regulator